MTFAPDDVFLVSPSTALGMAENLVQLLHTIVKNLPEAELRQVRAAMEDSVRLADELLYNIAISSTFEMLTLNDASTTLGGAGFSVSAASSRTRVEHVAAATSDRPAPPPSPVSVGRRGNTIPNPPASNNSRSIAVVRQPAVVRAPAPAPEIPADDEDGDSGDEEPGLIVSSRPNVGHPDYTLHPGFVRAGIPGPYAKPPVDPSLPNPAGYFVVTKGLYVGIFTSWCECSPWVTRVAASVYCRVRHWDEAQKLYNARLASGACEVLP